MLWPVGDDAIMCAFPIPSAVPETPPSAFPKSRPDPFTHRRPSKDTVHGPRPCANSPARLELSDVSGRLSTDLSPLECAVPRFRAVTPLECAVTKRPACKSFRMRSYEKKWGGGGSPNPHFRFFDFRSADRTHSRGQQALCTHRPPGTWESTKRSSVHPEENGVQDRVARDREL